MLFRSALLNGLCYFVWFFQQRHQAGTIPSYRRGSMKCIALEFSSCSSYRYEIFQLILCFFLASVGIVKGKGRFRDRGRLSYITQGIRSSEYSFFNTTYFFWLFTRCYVCIMQRQGGEREIQWF